MRNDIKTRLILIASKRDLKTNVTQKMLVNQKEVEKEIAYKWR